MSTFVLYLLLILPSVKATLTAITGAILGIVAVYAFGGTLTNFDAPDGEKIVSKIWHNTFKIAPWCLGMLILLAFIPSLQVVFALIGWELAGSDVFSNFSDLPPKMAEYLNAVLDQQLVEIRAD